MRVRSYLNMILKMSAIVSVLSKTPDILKELQRALPNIVFHQVQEIENDEQIRKSHIVIGDYDKLGPYIYNLPNLKWIQGTWAGIDALLPHIRTNELPSFPITRYTGKHFGHLIGEYVVTNIVNYERSMFEIKENQREQKWLVEGKINNHRSIYDLTVGILGIGNIGDKIAKILHYMGAKILGFARRPTLDLNEYKHIHRYFNNNNLLEFLQSCDYVINVLPTTAETTGLLNGRILENCKEKGTVFINVGRGTIISEKSLIEALEKKWISAAILDVFENEPLIKDSPLWKMPNVFISPHVSGMSRAKDIAEQFRENLTLFEQNLPIPATIDFMKGY